jgi:hypothetical protein
MDPFEVLGIDRNASEREVRVAFRRRVLESHPDRWGDAPEAEARLRQVIAAYEAALKAASGRPPGRERAAPPQRSSGPVPPERLRWVCPCCDDSYMFGGTECPRCEVALVDGWSTKDRRAGQHEAGADARGLHAARGSRGRGPEDGGGRVGDWTAPTRTGRTAHAADAWARALEARDARGPTWVDRHALAVLTWTLLLGGAALLHVHAPVAAMFLAYGALLRVLQSVGDRELARLAALRHPGEDRVATDGNPSFF